MSVVNLAEKFSRFDDHWHPRIVGALNGQHVKVVKLLGAFDWHHHDEEDELFLVVRGTMKNSPSPMVTSPVRSSMRSVPRGVEHRPVAESEVHVVLFEPASTRNTGTVVTERTRERLDWI
jgi:mannose-6-phosphate isomerase-like protein (cupin superfamily)